MRPQEIVFVAGSAAVVFFGAMLAGETILNLVLSALIVAFAIGRNRIRKERGSGMGRYFVEVVAFGAVLGIAAMVGTGLARTV